MKTPDHLKEPGQAASAQMDTVQTEGEKLDTDRQLVESICDDQVATCKEGGGEDFRRFF